MEGRETSVAGPQLPKAPEHPAPMSAWEPEQRFLVGDMGAGAEPQLLHCESLIHIGPGRFQLATAPSNSLQLHSEKKQILRKKTIQ